ncbi:hypothetical protein MD484_g7425, partial [Candolleomyces efflorescens]
MAASVPETAPFVRAAVIASPGIKNFPVPLTSVAMQMQRLVYGPFKSVTDRGPVGSLAGRPFLIVIDGLDECEDKEEVGELIDSMLAFFDDNPFIPLRVFVTSRVEQHIQSRLDVPGVRLYDLVDHCSDVDIIAFLKVLFQDAGRRNPVIKAYIREHGEWPTPSEKQSLVQHIGGSFIFASAVFKFIMGSNAPGNQLTTPMDRLPLALNMNPGLDGLYTQTLERSKGIPHFLPVISTIALLAEPLPTSGIAEILGIHTYEVVNVLVDLQAIIRIPGTDDAPVTLCHTSLRDFLTTESRSGLFFAHPRHHACLYLRFLRGEFELRRRRPGVPIHMKERTPAMAYSRQYLIEHLTNGRRFLEQSERESAIHLCRETLKLHPSSPELIQALADAIYWSAQANVATKDLEEAISLYRQALLLRPSANEDRFLSLYGLSVALMEYFHRFTQNLRDLDEIISLSREVLQLRQSRSGRADSLHNLAYMLKDRYQRCEAVADLEEAITLDREGLDLRPLPHKSRSHSLSSLSSSLSLRFRSTGAIADLEEAISLDREALNLQPPPHPNRPMSLARLAISLKDRYRHTQDMGDLEEAISLDCEALELRPSPHPLRSASLTQLAVSLKARYRRNKDMADLEEAISLDREALELQPPPHPNRSESLNNLGISLTDRYQRTKDMVDLEKAVSLHREALELRPSPHPGRPDSLWNLLISLWCVHEATGTFPDLQESITLCEELLHSHYPVGHRYRVETLDHLARLLQKRFGMTGQQSDRARIDALREEASRMSASQASTSV